MTLEHVMNLVLPKVAPVETPSRGSEAPAEPTEAIDRVSRAAARDYLGHGVAKRVLSDRRNDSGE